MVKKILPLLWLLTACTETPVTLEPHVDIDIYAELPYQNGYYYLDVVNGEKQTFGRLGGTIRIDGELPEQPVKATTPASSSTERIAPPAMTPVPSEAGCM